MWQFAMALIGPIFSFLFGWLRTALPFLAGFLGSTVTQVLLSFGVSVTTFTGFNVLTSYLLEYAVSGFSGLPVAITQLLGLMWVDKALNLMLSTAVGLMTIKGLKAGTISRGAWHKPGSTNGGVDA